jgi:DNA helicase-2/ATP-dependent DNA helicase PcrA
VFGSPVGGLRSRFLDELPSDLLDLHERDALRPLDARGGLGSFDLAGARGCGGVGTQVVASSAREPRAAERFRLGEDIVHAAFGEGVVTGVEPDGVIVVRFAGDGSERKLMAEYAPVSRR